MINYHLLGLKRRAPSSAVLAEPWTDDELAAMGRQVCFGKGSSTSSQPTTTTVNQNSVPDWAQPYLTQVLSQGQALSQNAYTPYPGQQIAPLTDQQMQAFQMAGQLGDATSPVFNQAQGTLGNAAQLAQGAANYTPGAITAGYNPVSYNAPTNFSSGYNPGAYGGTYDPANVTTGSWLAPGTAQSYMNPYQSAVTQAAIKQVQQQGDIQNAQLRANSAASGSFGGSREKVSEGLNNYYTQQNIGQIAAQGANQAYLTGQQQFNTEQNAGMQAQLANQANQQFAANLGTGQAQTAANLGLQAQGLGAQYGLSGAQLAAQQAQYGAGLNLQAQQAQEQANLNAAQLGLSGAQLQNTVGQNLGYLGTSMQNANLQNIDALQTAGGLQQAQLQSAENVAYQNFLNQLNYPYQQLGFQAGLINGLPVGTIGTTQQYQNPNTVSQLLGLGLGGLGLSKAISSTGSA